ncbi:MAG TPA: GIY-YIG nuclease family protein [Limnobacter sp.]|nr:GIY-YIG nuclease family protein [Limnobacter sp.]
MSQTKHPSLSRDAVAPQYWLYILSNAKPNGPLYLGDTTDLIARMDEHHAGLRRDYAHYHRLDRLVYFEVWDDLDKFNARLRRVRNWPRDMRLLLIESLNPDWEDLQARLREQIGDELKSMEQNEEKAA